MAHYNKLLQTLQGIKSKVKLKVNLIFVGPMILRRRHAMFQVAKDKHSHLNKDLG